MTETAKRMLSRLCVCGCGRALKGHQRRYASYDCGRRIRDRLTEPTLADFVYQEIVLRDPCVYCGRTYQPNRSYVTRTIDHIVPVSRGGEAGWTNVIGSCSLCNSGKCDRTLLRYLLFRVGVDAGI